MNLRNIGESNSPQERHNDGQEAGRKADFFERLGQSLIGEMLHSDEYNKGFKNGRLNQAEEDDE